MVGFFFEREKHVKELHREGTHTPIHIFQMATIVRSGSQEFHQDFRVGPWVKYLGHLALLPRSISRQLNLQQSNQT